MYKKETKGLLKHYDFVLLDLVSLQLSLILAFGICGNGFNPYNEPLYMNMAVLITVVSLIDMYCREIYSDVLRRGYYIEFKVAFIHATAILVVCLTIAFMLKRSAMYSRMVLGMTYVIYIVLSYIVKIAWKQILIARHSNSNSKRLLIVAGKYNAEDVIEDIRENSVRGFTIAGLVILEEDMAWQQIAGVDVVANADNAAIYVCNNWIDEVFIVPSGRDAYPVELVNQMQETGVTIHVNLVRIKNVIGKRQDVENIGSYTVLTSSLNAKPAGVFLVKRIVDIIGGLVGCILTVIITIFVGPAIYIKSPGPIFFSQYRVGKNGKQFKIHKFRSMYMDAEARKAELMKQNKISDGKMFKMDFDPRVIGNVILPDGTKKTGIGDFIRRTSLDEFPQFFNVLKGDMSLVGTRPPLPGEVSLYELHHRTRLSIKPGITGMWQISGRSDITDFEEVVRLDREYIDNWDFGQDIKILLKTVGVVLKRDGSV